MGPDNGVFTPVLHDTEVDAVVLHPPADAAPTFHGRDIFAPAAAALARGAQLSSLGLPFDGVPVRLAYTQPHVEGKSLVGEIVYVDHFGNLVTHLGAEMVPVHAQLEIEDLDLGPLRRTYSEVAPGALVVYVGSGRSVEIAVRDGSAADRLSIGVGARVRIRL